MSAISTARTALIAQISAALPTVQVLPVPPAEDEALKESIHVARAETAFKWRTLGMSRSNRSEDLTFTLVVNTYRESSTQRAAALASLDRADALLQAIEFAVADGLDLGGTVTQALVSGWTVEPVPYGKGWAARGLLTVTAENFPPC